MKHSRSVDKLAKMLAYVLGRQPDEFGLLPDAQGYVKAKALIKAMSEEPGWRHVRFNHVREVLYATRTPTIEIDKDLIRAVDRSRLPMPEVIGTFAKLLYCPVRRRAYPVILGKGLLKNVHRNRIILTDDIVLAQRLGRRIDPSAVILTVHFTRALKEGATIWRFGKQLFLSDCLPLGCFHGPALPKNRPQPKKVDAPKLPDAPKTPGSYFLDPTTDSTVKNPSSKGSRQRKNDWKRERKRKRRITPFSWTDK